MPDEALMEEGLGGDATPIEACPPDVTPLNDCNGETLSSSKDRRKISCGPLPMMIKSTFSVGDSITLPFFSSVDSPPPSLPSGRGGVHEIED